MSVTREHGTPYRTTDGPTALEREADGPGTRHLPVRERGVEVSEWVPVLALSVMVLAVPGLFLAGEWLYAVGIAAAVAGVTLIADVLTSTERRVAAARRAVGALPFPVDGLDEWFDPTWRCSGALVIALKERHPLLERAILRYVPVHWSGWTSETTFEVRPQWVGDSRDYAPLVHLLRDLLAKHHAELGVVRVTCRQAEMPVFILEAP